MNCRGDAEERAAQLERRLGDSRATTRIELPVMWLQDHSFLPSYHHCRRKGLQYDSYWGPASSAPHMRRLSVYFHGWNTIFFKWLPISVETFPFGTAAAARNNSTHLAASLLWPWLMRDYPHKINFSLVATAYVWIHNIYGCEALWLRTERTQAKLPPMMTRSPTGYYYIGAEYRSETAHGSYY